MTTATEQHAIVERFAERALSDSGDDPRESGLDALNWTRDGACEPWLFDDAVFERADAACFRMTDEERGAFLDTRPQTDMYYRTLEALRGCRGGRDFAKAHLIVAMYQCMETVGLKDEDLTDDVVD